jgi:hypothetical protein
MTPDDSPVDDLLKFYSVDSITDLEEILIEEDSEDVEDIELLAWVH